MSSSDGVEDSLDRIIIASGTIQYFVTSGQSPLFLTFAMRTQQDYFS